MFTSVLDNIQPGELVGSSLSVDDAGLWGGVIILGNAPVSTGSGDTEGQIEEFLQIIPLVVMEEVMRQTTAVFSLMYRFATTEQKSLLTLKFKD